MTALPALTLPRWLLTAEVQPSQEAIARLEHALALRDDDGRIVRVVRHVGRWCPHGRTFRVQAVPR